MYGKEIGRLSSSSPILKTGWGHSCTFWPQNPSCLDIFGWWAIQDLAVTMTSNPPLTSATHTLPCRVWMDHHSNNIWWTSVLCSYDSLDYWLLNAQALLYKHGAYACVMKSLCRHVLHLSMLWRYLSLYWWPVCVCVCVPRTGSH